MKSTTMQISAALGIAAAAAGCAKAGVTTGPAEPRKVEPLRSVEAAGPFVQAGTKVTLTMQDAIATETSREGDVFLASVDRDLASPSGEVVVPKGSTVRGHVARVRRGAKPALALELDTVHTEGGEASIQAKVLRADTVRSKGTAQVYDPYLTSYDRFSYPTNVVVYPSGPEPTPLAFSYYTVPTKEVGVPAGATITIELTRAILPPAPAVIARDDAHETQPSVWFRATAPGDDRGRCQLTSRRMPSPMRA